MLRLLLIDDDPGDIRMLTRQLSRDPGRVDLSVETAGSLADAVDILSRYPADVILLDLGLPESRGLETVDRACELFGHLPIVVLTGLDSEETGLESLRRGAGDYLIKGKFTVDLLVRAIRYAIERKQLELQLVHLARHDPLTRVLNRRAFTDILERAISHAKRGNKGVLMLFDIDHFKQINDTFGHHVGDDVLVRIVELVRKELRETDVLCRMGGDEFVVLLENTDIEGAHVLAERIRAVAGELKMEQDVQPSLSIGIAGIDGRLDVGGLLRQVDDCMYLAKSSGRDRICSA